MRRRVFSAQRRISMVATDNEVVRARLKAFFSETLSIEVPSIDADLIQTGILDSLALVALLACIEKEFGTEVSLDGVGIEDFHSIAKIAEYVDTHSPGLKA
jgi:acyl carrier protein